MNTPPHIHAEYQRNKAKIDQWVEFTRHFTHLRTGDSAKDRSLLLTVILADAINLGLAKMAEALSRNHFLQARHFASLACS
jgi:hypothetical protein